MTLGERIQSTRKKAGYTQQDLATKIGVATITVRQYELGKRQPNLETLQNIAKALETPLGELMGLEYMGGGLWGKEADPEVYVKVAENIEKFHGKKAQLNKAFDHLNEIGQQKAVENVEDLAKIPEYQKDFEK